MHLKPLLKNQYAHLALGLYLLNILDYIFTIRLIFWLNFKTEVEGNIFMRELFETDPIVVFVYKFFVIGTLILLLFVNLDKYKIAKIGLISLFFVYSALLVYHIVLVCV